MPKKKRVLFAAFEATPFIKTGGLGDVAGALPATLNSLDIDVRVKNKSIKILEKNGIKVISGILEKEGKILNKKYFEYKKLEIKKFKKLDNLCIMKNL